MFFAHAEALRTPKNTVAEVTSVSGAKRGEYFVVQWYSYTGTYNRSDKKHR
jgi:hypothetical protein